MKKYLAILKKETLQLVRDLPGLLILFIMPALMLIVITLTQQKVITARFTGVKLVLVNVDSSALGDSITKELTKTAYFSLVRLQTVKEAEKAIKRGKKIN